MERALSSRAKIEKRESVKFPTPKGLYVSGMPAQSRVLRVPYLVYERIGQVHTAHERRNSQRPAAKDKQRDIRLAHAGIAIGAIPQDGGVKLHTHPRSLAEWAAALGLLCGESVSRLFHRPGHSVIKAERSRGGKNTYRWNVAEKARSNYHSNCFQPCSPHDLAKVPAVAHLFSEDAPNTKFVSMPEIAHHGLSPLSSSERDVYVRLFQRGLFKYSKGDRRWKSGSVQITQEMLAAELGKHRDTVRRALRRMADKWTDRNGNEHRGLGLLKFIGKPGAWTKDGKTEIGGVAVTRSTAGAQWRQEEPNEYIGICDFVETDEERYNRCMEAVRATRADWAAVMDRIYKETRLDWLEEAKDPRTFHAECWRRMEDAGIPAWQIEIAIPRPPS